MKELVEHHVGGHLKVAPEHTDPRRAEMMRKPENDDFEQFTEVFNRESEKAGKEAVHRAVFHRQPSRLAIWTR